MFFEGALNVMSAGTPYPRHGAHQRHQEEWQRSEDIREMLLETLLLALFRSLELAVLHVLSYCSSWSSKSAGKSREKPSVHCPESSSSLPFLAC